MPILDIEGTRVEVGDDFMQLPRDQQDTTVHQIASQLKIGTKSGAIAPGAPAGAGFDRNDPRFQNMDVKAAVRGVPILGGLEPKAGAALSALAHPITGVGSPGETFSERYAKNLPQEEAASKAFEEEHPVRNALSEAVGGTLALGGAAGASPAIARALGMSGRLLPAAIRGATSGAAINSIDSAVRGGDPTTGALTGALTGAGGVLAGKALGRGVDAAARAFSKEAPVATRFMDVNGEQVPVPASTLSRDVDPALAARQAGQEQMYLRGGGGDEAQARAVAGQEATNAAMGRAHESFSAGLDPTGTLAGSTPEAAAATVGGDLVSQEAQRAAAEVSRGTRAAGDLAGIRTGLDPANPAPATPFEAGNAVSQAIREGATAARGARTVAYEAQAQLPGEFNPRHLLQAGNEVRAGLNAPGEGRVRISPDVTPMASRALEVIDQDVAGLRFPNEAARGARPITPADIEQVRKDLVQLRGAANRAARQNGNWEDARAVGRVMDEFDAFVSRTAQRAGGFSGDAQAYLLGQQRARALHANYRQTYSSQGPGDKVGQFIENVIGKYPGQELTPDAIAQKLFGSANNMGAGDTVQIVTRLRNMWGENSPEWAAIRKAALSHLTEGLDHGAQADRILEFFNGTRGQLLGQTLFSPSERANLMRYANQIRGVADPQPAAGAQSIIARWSGRDGHPPASTTDIVNHLFDLRANKEATVQVMRELKRQLTPESFAQIKQGMFHRLTQPAEGATAWGDQKIANNILNFLKGEGSEASALAKELYTPNERMLLKTIADAHNKLVPIPGSTNPSGTATMAARIAKGASKQLLALFGFAHGGLPGASLALAGGKALSWAADKQAAGKATEAFFGRQPRGPISPNYQRAGAIAGQVAPALTNQ